jgi:hypothetical protein
MADAALPIRPVAVSQQFTAKHCGAKNGRNLRKGDVLGSLQNQPKGKFA